MLLKAWRRLLPRHARKGARSCPPVCRRPAKLFVEVLEDRVLLSTLMVATVTDSATFKAGDGSLRGEIAAAKSGDTIQFSSSLAGQTINLTDGELLLNKNLSILGLTTNGTPGITINAGGKSRIFDVEGGTSGISVNLQNLTVKSGAANQGAGLFINDSAGTVTLTNLNITGNIAVGAAGANGANGVFPARATQPGMPGHDAQGGGVFFQGGPAATLVISNSTLQNNRVNGGSGGQGGNGGVNTLGSPSGVGVGGAGGSGGAAEGGGLYVNGGNVLLNLDTIKNNSLTGGQGGMGGAGNVTASTHGGKNAAGGSGGSGGAAFGGGLYVNRGSIQLQSVTVSGNTANGGTGNIGGPGGNMAKGSPAPSGASGFGGPAEGGGVFVLASSIVIGNSALIGNVANGGGSPTSPGSAFGGALTIPNGDAQLFNDTIALNAVTPGAGPASNALAESFGGGLADLGGNLQLTNDTLANNTASAGFFSNGQPGINAFNAFGGALANLAGTVELANTIFAFNNDQNPLGTGAEIYGTINSSSHDLIDNDSDFGLFTPGVGDLVGVPPNLAPLGFYAGATETMPLLPGSPGIDAGANSFQGPATIPGLADWYRGEGNAADSAGTNKGTIVGGVSFTPGVVGQAFNFNGQGSYIDLGTGLDILGTGAFAVAAWVKTTATGGMILNQRDPTNYNGEYALSLNGGKVAWSTFGNNQSGFNVTSNETVSDGKWHYVVGVRLADGTGQIYIDGKLDNSQTPVQGAIPVPLGSGFHVYIGEDVRNAVDENPSAPNNFIGQIDEVQIYHQALTAAQIQSLAVPLYTATGLGPTGAWPTTLPGLVSWLPADGNYADAAGSNPGTPIGGVRFTTGMAGQAFQLDGSSGKISIADSPSLDSRSFTVGGWFQLTQAPAAGSQAELASKYDGNYHGWILAVGSNLVPLLAVAAAPSGSGSSPGVVSLTSSTPLALNKWYYIAATYDGTNATLYVNGQAVASGTLPGGYTPSATPLVIGAESWFNALYLAGKVDNFVFCNQALTPAEVGLLSIPVPTDQRGGARSVGPQGDIGATEYQYDLSVLDSGPSTVTIGNPITYTLTVTNKGLDPVPSVTLTDTLPPGETFQSLSLPAGWVQGVPSGQNRLAFSGPGLAPGASARFVLTATVNGATTPGTILINTASVGPVTEEANAANNMATVATTVANLISPTPSGVDIKGQPTNGVVGQPIGGPITVSVVNTNGNTVPGSSIPVTLAIASGPAGAVLGGTTTVETVNGVATFRDLTLNEPGTYTLEATGGTLTPDFSNPFTIAAVSPPPAPPSPPPPSPLAPALSVPSLLGFVNALLKGMEAENADGSTTLTDSLFGLPLLVSTFDASGHLVSVTFLGMNVTGLFVGR